MIYVLSLCYTDIVPKNYVNLETGALEKDNFFLDTLWIEKLDMQQCNKLGKRFLKMSLNRRFEQELPSS